MHKILFLSMLLLIACNLSAQRLTGVVFDKETHEPVSGAYIYMEGSSLHDVTNTDGRFEISINSVVNLPLVFSHVSYQTKVITNPFTSLPDTLFVEKKENLLGEVVVQAGRHSRKQLLNAFRKEFLGQSQSASSCIIENEDKIDIWFNDRTHMLSANCDEPVLIHNRYLGYKLYLTLNKFEAEYPSRRFTRDNPLVLFDGSAFFEDLEPSNKRIAGRRDFVHEGSSRHFLRALINGQLSKSDYWLHLKGDDYAKPPAECFTVIDSLGQKGVIVNPQLRQKNTALYGGKVCFGEINIQRGQKMSSRSGNRNSTPRPNERNEASLLVLFTGSFLVDGWGNLSQSENLLLLGYMGELRIGDLLPANYGITESKSE